MMGLRGLKIKRVLKIVRMWPVDLNKVKIWILLLCNCTWITFYNGEDEEFATEKPLNDGRMWPLQPSDSWMSYTNLLRAVTVYFWRAQKQAWWICSDYLWAWSGPEACQTPARWLPWYQWWHLRWWQGSKCTVSQRCHLPPMPLTVRRQPEQYRQ